jgi:3'-phosphoadenosine 5'-phosphosulfate sulfotransferase (PAPS reductase)/FAD synthetase
MAGGKGSAAPAIDMRDRIPNKECIFPDTRKELPETYEYLDRIEAIKAGHQRRMIARDQVEEAVGAPCPIRSL